MSGPEPQALAQRVEDRMATYSVPGVAIGVVDADGPRAWGFGVTNVDHPLPVDPDTVFEIASITKTMTATVAARLAASGQLDLDAPVRRYLPEFAVADAAVGESVTVRDLFTHTAGWFGEYLAPTGRGDDAIAKAVSSMATLEQVAPVGTFSYNNVSLIVAGRVIEVVSGRAYRDAVRELLFGPLGMDHSAFDAADVLYERVAAGHTVRDGRTVRVRNRLSDSSSGDPVGGVRSTVNDLLRYARFHLGDGTAPDGTAILPAGALRAMREPRVPTGQLSQVGLSWFLDDRGGTTVATHGGATVAHMSQLALVPDRGAAVVILTNGANGVRLCADLQEWLLRDWLGLPARATPAILERQPDLTPYAGRYWAPLSDVELSAQDGALVMRITWKGSVAERPTPPPLALAFTGADTVVAAAPSDAPPVADFLRNPEGAVEYFRWGGRARKKVG
ncbi:MAG TPA: serine hydrolase [Candidatus Limnocylindria bacterium]